MQRGKWSDYFGKYRNVRNHVLNHATKPQLELKEHQEQNRKVFADGCGFYKLFWVFLLSGFIGDIIEIFWCRFTMGYWMSRSSLVYGQFSIVWGLGCFLLTLMLHRLIGKEDRYIFISGVVLGGAFEYVCSLFTELAFGVIFWDYSKIPFNINGRVNLLFCFFWGVVAIVWLKIIYPWMSKLIERIPIKFGKVITWITVIFFVFNIIISTAALYRIKTRSQDIPAPNWAEEFVDANFSDTWIAKRYRNLKVVPKS